jgi:hypothetical protein
MVHGLMLLSHYSCQIRGKRPPPKKKGITVWTYWICDNRNMISMISFLYIGPKSCHVISDIIQLHLCRTVKSYYIDHTIKATSQEGMCYTKILSQKSGLLRRTTMTIQDLFPGSGDLILPSLSGIVVTCHTSHHSLITEAVTAYKGIHWQSTKPCELISKWHTTWILDNGSSNNLQNVEYSFNTDSASFSHAPKEGAPRLRLPTK